MPDGGCGMKSIRSPYQRRNVAHARRVTPEGAFLTPLRPGQVRCPECGQGARLLEVGRLRSHWEADGITCPNRIPGGTASPTWDAPPVVIAGRGRPPGKARKPSESGLRILTALPLLEEGSLLRIHAVAEDDPQVSLCRRPVGEPVGASLQEVTCRSCRQTRLYRKAAAA